MSLRRTLDAMALSVGRAKSVPLSASCWVNRAEMLSLIERARAELPAELDEATQILIAHQEVLDNAEREGEQVLDSARARAAAMVEDTVIVASAQARADAILHAARTEATRLLRSADEYCDRRLGVFQSDLEKALHQVSNGRARLQERSELDNFAEETGLAAAADAVDDAAYQASQQYQEARARRDEVHDQEADSTPSVVGPDSEETAEAGAEPDPQVVAEANGHDVNGHDVNGHEVDGYDLTDAMPGPRDGDQDGDPPQVGERVIDLREDAEPAGLGPGRTLQ